MPLFYSFYEEQNSVHDSLIRLVIFYQVLFQWGIDISKFIMSYYTMKVFYALAFPILLVWIPLHKENMDAYQQEELWLLILESDDQLTWEEGIYFHYLTQKLLSW